MPLRHVYIYDVITGSGGTAWLLCKLMPRDSGSASIKVDNVLFSHSSGQRFLISFGNQICLWKIRNKHLYPMLVT